MTPVAETLAAWAAGLEPSDDDLALARRSLVDTVAVAMPRGRTRSAICSASCPTLRRGPCSRTSSTSTTCTWGRRRTSAPCACPRCWRPAATRAPTSPGPASWPVWAPRWAGRTTRPAGTPLHGRGSGRGGGAAVASASPPSEVATAMALAVPAAGGVQRAFGTDGQGAAGRRRGAGGRARGAARGRRRVRGSARARPVARARGRRCAIASRSTAPPSPAAWP